MNAFSTSLKHYQIRGFQIDLGDIETAIHQHSAVRETVAAREEIPGDQRLVAYVVAERSPADQSLNQQERTQQWQKCGVADFMYDFF